VRRQRRRRSLATRIAVLSACVAVGTALLAGLLSVGLILRSDGGRQQLANLADAAQAREQNRPVLGAAAVQRLLRAVDVQNATVDRSGAVTGDDLAVAAVREADVQRLRAGRPVSANRTVGGDRVYVEARPTGTGGIVLVERRSDADALANTAVRRIVLALLVAAGIAALLGMLVAARLARPLRRTAVAAHALAAGRRDVTVPPEGPTEVADVAEAINTLSAELAASEGRQRDFLLSVSHDLRTPLTAISAYAESLADGVVPPSRAAETGTVMLAEAKRLDRLVADLLDLARLDASDFRLDVTTVDLTALVEAAGTVWADRCRAAGVPFRTEAPGVPLWTATDPGRIRQAVDGLLENALRVTPAGAPIVLATRAEPGVVLVEVRDGGPGLTEADLPVAFERGELYRRYRGVRQVGTGLGLAIVRSLVTRLGGTVEAGRAAEGGARFTIALRALT